MQDPLDKLDDLLRVEDAHRRREATERSRALSDPEREEAGDLVRSVELVAEEPGYGGRFALSFERPGRVPLPPGAISAGDIVRIEPPAGAARDDDEGGARPVRGTVARRSEDRIVVVVDDEPPAWLSFGRHRLERLPDDVTHKRMARALDAVRRARGDRLAELREVLVGRRDEPPGEPAALPEDIAEALDDAQREAVARALAAPSVFLIHGPPGTGKTTAVTALVRAAVRRGEKVLACAPSNAAVDLLAERASAAGLKVVRLGHPVRIDEAVQRSSLDVLTDAHPDARLSRDLLRQAEQRRKALWRRRRVPSREERRAARDEMRALIADARRLAAHAAQKVLNDAEVVCATLAGATPQALGDRRFDLVVIDEAAQALEPAAWIPLGRARRVVLAGDHHQLPPTVTSPEALAAGLGRTLFERAHDTLGPRYAHMLTVQYRMHEAIAAFSSARFYEGRLRAAPANAAHTLADLPDVAGGSPFTVFPFLVVDTAGAGLEEERREGSPSVRNKGEASVVVRLVQALRDDGVALGQIGIIAPYSAQVATLRDRLAEAGLRGPEVATADGFQGREQEAIILSMTRSNERGGVGFLADIRRMNVAMTRARRCLLAVLDSATVAQHPFYAALLDHAAATGALTSVWEHDLLG